MSEKAVKQAVKNYLRSIGAYFFMPVQWGYGSSTVDFLVCHKGKFYGVETKREGCTSASARQSCILREIAEAGGGVCIENSTDCPAVKNLIK